MDKDECRANGGRGPCSHACQNIYGDYTCTCEKGYRVHGRTQCVILDCGTPNFSSCPPEDNKKTWSMSNEDLPLCKAVIFSCPNGTKYNAQCSLSCPLNYGLALKDPNQSWSHYQAFDFRTPSNRIMCQVELETSVFWHTQLSRYYCRRKNDPPLSIQLNNTVIDEKLPPGTLVGRLNAVDAQYNQKMVYSVHSLRGKPLFRCHGPILESSVIFKWKPNAENSYPVRIRAQDNGSPRMWIEQVFNITLLNVNDPPRSIEISKNSVYENSSIGTIVGTLTAIDDDFSQQRSSNFSWKLLTNNSGNFNVSGADVVVTKRLNYDLFRVHYITVACGDSIAFSERVLLVYVINSIDPPTLRLTGHKIPENSKIGAVVGQIEAKSERRGDMVFNLSPSGPAVQTKFVLSPSPICIHHQNAIKFNSTCFVNLTVSGHLDFEEQSEYVVQVFVKNKQSSNFKKWNLTIENVNEKPDKLDFNGMMSIPEATKSGVDFCFLLVS